MAVHEVVYLFLIELLNLSIAQQVTCGSIGNSNEITVTPLRAQLFYLNTANPAPCTGNITSWRVCYYGPDTVDNSGSYWATYAVYRRMGSGDSIRYVRVSEMFSAVRTISRFTGDPVVDGEIAQGGFNCYDDAIDASASPVTIQAGDILGACVFDPSDILFIVIRLPLDVVGQASAGSLLRMSTAECSRENIPADISANQLSTIASRRLHIYANIVELPMEESSSTTTLPLTTTTPIPLTTLPTHQAYYHTTAAQTPLLTTELDDTPTMEHPTISTVTATNSLTSNETTAPKTESIPTATILETSNIPGAGRSILSLRVIVGIIIGVLVLVFLGVASAAALFCLVRRNSGEKYSSGRGKKEKTHYGVDNIIYEESVNEVHGGNAFNASAYEVPVDTLSAHTKRITEHHQYHEQIKTAAMYEYATSGPNEQMRANYYEHNYFTLEERTIPYSKLLERNKQEDIYGDLDEYLQPAIGESELYDQIKACGIQNIPSNLIQIKRHLGSGQFGSVEQGVWKNGQKTIQVAVKLLKEGATEMDKVKFLQEAAIMAQFTHPNVVSLYGVVSKSEPLMLVVELIEKGDLRNHLHTMRPDPGELPAANMLELLLNFSQQVALGMHYLSAKRFVHRDLAARNILVSRDNLCKVADFGMSRDLADENYYVSHGGVIPIKWTAPEAIHYKKYSTASDVWSYGCLLYEIWSLGYKPFEGIGNAEPSDCHVLTFKPQVIDLVSSGQQLPPPPGCSKVIYELMIKCWNPVAAQRPSFRELLLTLLDDLTVVLSIPPEAIGTHPLAGVLGSSIDAGESMYRDLQDRYRE